MLRLHLQADDDVKGCGVVEISQMVQTIEMSFPLTKPFRIVPRAIYSRWRYRQSDEGRARDSHAP